MEDSDQNVWNDFDQLGFGKPGSTTHFLEVGARVLLKLATKVFLRGKRTQKIFGSGCFSKRKTEEFNQKV